MEKHERPVNAKCQRQNVSADDSVSSMDSDIQSNSNSISQDISIQILTELKHLSGRIQEVEKKV